MNIRRPQQETGPISRRYHWWQFSKRWRTWRDDRDYCAFKRNMERMHQAEWTLNVQCHLTCRAIIPADAGFCDQCGRDLHPITEPLLSVTLPAVKPTIPVGSVRAVYLQASGGSHTKAMEAVNAVKLAEQQATGKLHRDAIKQRIQEEQLREKERQQ